MARKVTEHLKGEWHGTYGEAPSPGHSAKDRSLSIKPHETDPEDVVLYSHTNGDWQSIKDDLRKAGILPEKPVDGVTLDLYASAKKLPVAFLRELGLETVPSPWKRSGHKVQNVLAIPYRNADGKLIRTRYRVAMSGEKKHFWDKQKGCPLALYGLDRLPDSSAERLLLVEGESDTQTLWYHGYDDALGVPGATNFQTYTRR